WRTKRSTAVASPCCALARVAGSTSEPALLAGEWGSILSMSAVVILPWLNARAPQGFPSKPENRRSAAREGQLHPLPPIRGPTAGPQATLGGPGEHAGVGGRALLVLGVAIDRVHAVGAIRQESAQALEIVGPSLEELLRALLACPARGGRGLPLQGGDGRRQTMIGPHERTSAREVPRRVVELTHHRVQRGG